MRAWLLMTLLVLVMSLPAVAVEGTDPSLVLSFSFDEGSGSVAKDSSGHGNDGRLFYETLRTTGRIGGGLSFGDTGYVEVPNSESLNVRDGLTIMSWLKPATTNFRDARCLVGKPFHYVYGLYVEGSGHEGPASASYLCLQVNAEKNCNRLEGPRLVTSWMHAAATYDAATRIMRIYHDGRLVGERKVSGSTGLLDTNEACLRIGGARNRVFDGVVDEVRVYSRALSPAEIEREYTLQRRVPETTDSVPRDQAEREELSFRMRRTDYYRGETVLVPVLVGDVKRALPAGELVVSILDGKRVVGERRQSVALTAVGPRQTVQVSFPTADLASREYYLEARIVENGKTLVSSSACSLFLHARPRVLFPYGPATYLEGFNRLELHDALQDIKAHNCNAIANYATFEAIERFGELFTAECARNGVVVAPNVEIYRNGVFFRTHTPGRMKLPDGRDDQAAVSHNLLCFNYEPQRAVVEKEIEALRRHRAYPVFSDVFFTFDDVHIMYGDPAKKQLACYCDACRSKFERLTGLKPPVSPPAKKGVIPDNEPWLEWMKFRCRDTYGDMCRFAVATKDRLAPEIRLGNICCGQPSQMSALFGLYPPYGAGVFDVVSYYFYPRRWREPTMAFVFQNELVRVGSRGKPVMSWAELGAQPDHGYSIPVGWMKSQFFMNLAGNSKGIFHYIYGHPQELSFGSGHWEFAPRLKSWEEVKETGALVNRYGALLAKLDQAPAKVGLLLSFACNAFDPFRTLPDHYLKTKAMFYACLRRQLPIEIVSEEEIVEGRLARYDALILTEVDYLTESAYQAVDRYLEKGGRVFADADSEIRFDRKEVIDTRTIDTAINEVKIAAAGEVPASVGDTLRLFSVCDSRQVVLRELTGGGVPFLAAVNTEIDRETSAVVHLAKDGYCVYDVFGGKEIPLSNGDLKLVLPPAEGKLLALYPERVGRVDLTVPERVGVGETLSIGVRITGEKSGRYLDGLQPIFVQVFNPAGELTEYSVHDVADHGLFNMTVRLALNEKPGNWKVLVTELCSGQRNEKTVIIR